MILIVVGTNQKFSPVELRERLFFSKKRIKDALFFLKGDRVIKGAAILSTCNRVEIYASVEDAGSGIEAIEDFISRFHEIDKQRILPYLYIYEGEEALRHLFLVSCGLDSLILGETQISGQVKEALLEAENIGFDDGLLREIFDHALSFTAKIHRETKISEGKVSVGSIAIDFIKKQLGNLSNKNILIIGIGKVTELVLKYLRNEKPNVVFVANRTFEKAKALANQIKAVAVRFDRLREFLGRADVIITATASPHFIIKKETLEGVVKQGILIIDLALPRDVDPRVKEIKGVELFCLEDLDIVIKANIKRKKEVAEKVKRLINIEVEKRWAEFTKLEPEPALLP